MKFLFNYPAHLVKKGKFLLLQTPLMVPEVGRIRLALAALEK